MEDNEVEVLQISFVINPKDALLHDTHYNPFGNRITESDKLSIIYFYNIISL